MCIFAMKHTPVKKSLRWLHGSIVWCVYWQPSTTLQNSTLKREGQNSESIYQEAFDKIPSVWEAALETERRYFSKVILGSNVTPNITKSLDSFSTVLPIINGGDREALCVTWRLYYHWLNLIRIQFRPPKVTPITYHTEVTVQGLDL